MARVLDAVQGPSNEQTWGDRTPSWSRGWTEVLWGHSSAGEPLVMGGMGDTHCHPPGAPVNGTSRSTSDLANRNKAWREEAQ